MTVQHFPSTLLHNISGCKTEVLGSALETFFFHILYEVYSSLDYCVLPIVWAMVLNTFFYFSAKT